MKYLQILYMSKYRLVKMARGVAGESSDECRRESNREYDWRNAQRYVALHNSI